MAPFRLSTEYTQLLQPIFSTLSKFYIKRNCPLNSGSTGGAANSAQNNQYGFEGEAGIQPDFFFGTEVTEVEATSGSGGGFSAVISAPDGI